MKVTIRQLRIEDAEISWRWRNDPVIWEMTGRKWNNHVTEDIEKEWIQNVIKEENSRRFAICVGEEADYIGNVQLTNITETDATFHIFIGNKQYWGKGVGTKATSLVLDYAKEKLRINSIKLFVNKNNIAAIKLYQNVGFKLNVLKEDGTFLMEYPNE